MFNACGAFLLIIYAFNTIINTRSVKFDLPLFSFCRILFEMNFRHCGNDCDICLYFSFFSPAKQQLKVAEIFHFVHQSLGVLLRQLFLSA